MISAHYYVSSPAAHSSRLAKDEDVLLLMHHDMATMMMMMIIVLLQVIVHPLVLLSTVDHYNRVAKDTRKRVVGVLLGTSYKGRIDVTNSFAGTIGRRL
jgi:uncharacterized protein (DUF2236 family)